MTVLTVKKDGNADLDPYLGAVVMILNEQGVAGDEPALQAAALLMEASGCEGVYLTDWRGDDGGLEVRLIMPPQFFGRFSESIRERALEGFSLAMGGYGHHVELVTVAPELPGDDWRERLGPMLGRTVSNQGVTGPRDNYPYQEDGFYFRSPLEVTVWRALRRIQAEYQQAKQDSFTMSANIPKLTPSGKTIEVDIEVTFRKRTAIIEVDDPSHYGRRAADTSRDRLLREGGICFVERVVHEDVLDPKELETVLRKFLRQLATS